MGQLLGQRLILAGAADRQILPLGAEGRRLVAVGRDVQFAGDAFGQVTGQRRALFQRNPRNRDQRQDVRGAHARVRPLVAAHVDQLRGPLHAGKGRSDNRFGVADEGYDRAVGRLARIHIKHLHAARRLDGRHDLSDHLLVASLAEIGHALHDTFLHKLLLLGFFCFKYTNFFGIFPTERNKKALFSEKQKGPPDLLGRP